MAFLVTSCYNKETCDADTGFPTGTYHVYNASELYLFDAEVSMVDEEVFVTYERDGVIYVAHYRRR